MGGDPAGDINHDQHDFALWEKRVDALMVLASSAGLMNTDSLRRVLEDMGEEAYETMTYYERWIASVSQNMVEAGAFSTAELAEKMAQVKTRGATYGDAT
ncbi:MAG TPA: ScnB-like protein [Rhodobacteraceae bacterium]|nr:ScnB-like protein [Paracoccaceae bacterium]